AYATHNLSIFPSSKQDSVSRKSIRPNLDRFLKNFVVFRCPLKLGRMDLDVLKERRMKHRKSFGVDSRPVLRLFPLSPSVFLFFFCVSPCEAAAPVLKALEPRGAQQGQVLTLKLKGTGLAPGAEISAALPGSVTRLAPPADLPGAESELPLLVQL